MTCKAYAINTDTGELTEWLEVGFSRLWQLNGKSYLVRSDGVYAMDEARTVPDIEASIQLAPSRFGTEQTKRLRYIMTDGEGDVVFTPIYDSVLGNPYIGEVGSDGGIKVGRGNKSRWIAGEFISTSKQFSMTSLRLYFEELSRRSL